MLHTGPVIWTLEAVTCNGGSGTVPSAAVVLWHKDGTLYRDAGTGDGPIDAVFKTIERITGIEPTVRDFFVKSVTVGEDAQGEAHVEAEYRGPNPARPGRQHRYHRGQRPGVLAGDQSGPESEAAQDEPADGGGQRSLDGIMSKRASTGGSMASPHPGMHILCPVCEGPIPDLLGELTDEPAGINAGTRSVDCYYCEAPLICVGFGSLLAAPSQPPPAKRTARKREIKFDDGGVDIWINGMEQALHDEANNPHRDPKLPAITRTKMVNKFGKRAFEDMDLTGNRLGPSEEEFLRALLWEEGHLLRGPATRMADEHGLSLIRCLEPANRLSPNLQGEALNDLRDNACPKFDWPWGEQNGDEVLQMLWARLAVEEMHHART